MWYHNVIGGERCPIVDTWWQTETGAIMISPLPGRDDDQARLGTQPLPGIVAEIVDENGEKARGRTRRPAAHEAALAVHAAHALRRSRALQEHVLQQDPGRLYFTGDGARRDDDGYYWVMGRVDDVLNVAGHRLSTMEVESALVAHPAVAEAAVVGRPDELKGQAIAAFVTLKDGGRGPRRSTTS